MPPLVSRLRLDEPRHRSHDAQIVGVERRAVARHERRRVGAVREPERARAARGSARASGARQLGDAQRDDGLAASRRRPAALAHPRLAREQRLALEQLAQRVEIASSVSPGNASAKPPPRATAALISAPV